LKRYGLDGVDLLLSWSIYFINTDPFYPFCSTFPGLSSLLDCSSFCISIPHSPLQSPDRLRMMTQRGNGKADLKGKDNADLDKPEQRPKVCLLTQLLISH